MDILVTAYGWNHTVIFTDRPINEVKGMAWDVRDDALTGRRLGLVGNRCSSPDSQQVYYWDIKTA